MADEASRKEVLAKFEGSSDPLRVRVLTALILGPASAGDLAAALDVPIGKVRYQLGRLRKAGLVELREEKQRRGVVERIYFHRPYFFSVEDNRRLTEEEIDRVHAELFRAMVQDFVMAVRTKSYLSREDFMAARAPMRLDEQGWKEAAELQQETLERLLEIHASASARFDQNGDQSISALAFLLLFEVAPTSAKKDQ